ncbi:MAG: molecular chaperone HtpG [Alphaproteobacteria bacterium CG11_big_fil_rev_8_21_14_0_20_39_49]|nr:MAG: molecular chaperone HtpG [Alphaproteobacteria bacterium CG11_big_fil_rev_8_21_14_0_20_39_49]
MAKEKMVETHEFGAETGKILQLMIHSLYAHKDIFLRELISNASDACDKLRYDSLTNKDLKVSGEFKITITANEKDKTLTIADNGIGMNKEDMIRNLGTIASSGTQRFLENATGDAKKDIQLIGQFGVGFYSSFMVADEVSVISKKAGEKEAYKWTSKADGKYSIEEVSEDISSGTVITLFLKEDSEEFLDKHRIKHIIRTYSDHISFPVEFTDSEGEVSVINTGSALWTKNKSDITKEQYNEFYKHVAHAGDEPWMVLHNKAEGVLEYTNLLFIPSAKPFDLFHPDRQTRVKLYVKRVFISEENNKLVPEYLRFLRGVVDSEDLPLNISRETLQHNNVIHKIRNAITKKVLNELKKKAEKEPEEYTKFWDLFGSTVKEGLCEGIDANRELLLEVCHFKTTKSGDKYLSLDKYIENMQEGQDKIYYLAADSIEAAKNSPQLEGFLKRDIEVILLTDSVDDFWVNVNGEYKGTEIVPITRAGLDLDKKEEAADSDENKKDNKPSAELEKTINYFKEILGSKVFDVVESKKLADSPVCLTTQEGGMDMRMERFLVAQKQLVCASPKVLEINPSHSIIQYIGDNIGSDKSKDLVELLLDQAFIVEGEAIADTSAFSKRFSSFIEKALAA